MVKDIQLQLGEYVGLSNKQIGRKACVEINRVVTQQKINKINIYHELVLHELIDQIDQQLEQFQS